MKFLENCKKILKKFKRNWEENFNWFQENNGNFIEKNWSNLKLIQTISWRNFRKFFWNNFSEIQKTTKKSNKNYEKIWETLCTNFYKSFWWKFCEIFKVTFRRTCKELWKYQIILKKNCRGTLKKFWEYLGCSQKYTQGVSKIYPALKILTIFYWLVLQLYTAWKRCLLHFWRFYRVSI